VIPLDTTSNSSSQHSKSKFNHSVAHSKLPKSKKKPLASVQKTPYTMVKSKSDLNTLKTYPDSFTIVASPKRSPSAGYQNKRRKSVIKRENAKLKENANLKENVKLKEDDDDSIMDFEWKKPPAEKLYEAGRKYLDEPTYVPGHFKEPVPMSPPAYLMDHFGTEVQVPMTPPFVIDNYGKQISMPTSPIITDRVMIGSSHR
jgi:hypothetical protein